MATLCNTPVAFGRSTEVIQRCGHKARSLKFSDKDRALLARRDCKACWIAKRKNVDAALMPHALRMCANCAPLDGTEPQRNWATLIRYRTLASLRSTTAPSGLEAEWRRGFAIAKAIGRSEWWIERHEFLLGDPYRAFEVIAQSSGESVMTLAAARMRANLRPRLPLTDEELDRVWGKVERV